MHSLSDMRHILVSAYRLSGPDSATEDTLRAILENYDEWTPPQTPVNAIEVFAPTVLQPYGVGDRKDIRANWRFPDAKIDQWIRGLTHLCLYADKLWVPDPVELLARNWISKANPPPTVYTHQPLIADPEITLEALAALEKLQPLIDRGVIGLYPALASYKKWIEGDTNIELPDPWFDRDVADDAWLDRYLADNLRDAWPDRYVAEGLLYAAAFGATYTALYHDEYQALEAAAGQIAKLIGVADSRVLSSLPHMKLPYFDGISPQVLANARDQQDAFEDFRVSFRQARVNPHSQT